MSGGMDATASDNLTSVGSKAYSFYLNVVVLNHLAGVSAENSTTSTEPSEPQTEQQQQPEDQADAEASEAVEEISDLPASNSTDPKDVVQNFGSLLNRSMHNTMNALSKSSKAVLTDKSIQGTMKAITKNTKAVSEKATRFVASTTMVSRANQALIKSVPELVEQTGLKGMRISRKFHEGSVFVLQVDLKPTELPAYIAEVKGEEAAENYRSASSCLKSLNATATLAALEKEMLPQVRQGLMDKWSEKLIEKMKAKEDMLEVECIALEETEEARWLFTFMEFKSQMK